MECFVLQRTRKPIRDFKNTLQIKTDKLTRMWFTYLEFSCFSTGMCLIGDMTMISAGVIILRQDHAKKCQSQAWRGLIINNSLNPLRKFKAESLGFWFVCTSHTKSLERLMEEAQELRACLIRTFHLTRGVIVTGGPRRGRLHSYLICLIWLLRKLFLPERTMNFLPVQQQPTLSRSGI